MPTSSYPIAITMGEPTGIGGEIVLKAWKRQAARAKANALPCFFSIDTPKRLQSLARHLKIDVPIAAIKSPQEAMAVFSKALPVLTPDEKTQTTPVGKNTSTRAQSRNARAVLSSLNTAVSLALQKKVAAIVTLPVDKAILAHEGFAYVGQTEYLQEKAGRKNSAAMVLCNKHLRVALVTRHIPLAQVSKTLSTTKIVTTGMALFHGLKQDFSIKNPRLAMAALNPHGGDKGLLGKEEQTILRPALTALREKGVVVHDIAPADSLFHEKARRQYDGVLCMYHDQALIPLKTLDFMHGVNVTLGLPIVRTSPDHGTALDIASKGVAQSHSLEEAIKLAHTIAQRRQAFEKKS